VARPLVAEVIRHRHQSVAAHPLSKAAGGGKIAQAYAHRRYFGLPFPLMICYLGA
jgi:hypothetical protein